MDLIEKYTPYTFDAFMHYHPITLMLATSGLIVLSFQILEFIRLLKLCKKAGIKYKDVRRCNVKWPWSSLWD